MGVTQKELESLTAKLESDLRKRQDSQTESESVDRLKRSLGSCKLALKGLNQDLRVEKSLIPKLQDSEVKNFKDLSTGKIKKAKTSLVSVPSNIGDFVK